MEKQNGIFLVQNADICNIFLRYVSSDRVQLDCSQSSIFL